MALLCLRDYSIPTDTLQSRLYKAIAATEQGKLYRVDFIRQEPLLNRGDLTEKTLQGKSRYFTEKALQGKCRYWTGETLQRRLYKARGQPSLALLLPAFRYVANKKWMFDFWVLKKINFENNCKYASVKWIKGKVKHHEKKERKQKSFGRYKPLSLWKLKCIFFYCIFKGL